MKNTILLLVLGIFLISACAQQKSAERPEDLVGQGTPVPQKEAPQQVAAEKPQAEEKTSLPASQTEKEQAQQSEVKEFRLTAKQWSFEPATIEVGKGDKVRIIVTSIDVTHGFALPEYDINERLEPNKQVTIEFVADKEGTFTFFCSVFCGSGHSGMKGKLIVR